MRPVEAAATIGGLVHAVGRILTEADVPDAAAEARDLVAVLAGHPRFWPTLHSNEYSDPRLVQDALAAARRRAAGAPFAYAAGRAAFRHLTLHVDERVLIPRQETEVLVDLVLQECRDRTGGVVADVCTGSGAIALALASEGRFDRVIACDVASDALRVARDNAARLPAAVRDRVEFRAGDLLVPLAGERLDVLVSNPPYIAWDEAVTLPASVRNWEPMHALLSGAQGLEATHRLVTGAPPLVCSGGLLALEVDARRALLAAETAAAHGAWTDITVHLDLTGRERFVLARRR
jgi:release factor glutamine methyltransferase